ncbi:hypothetical protein CHS0354_017925 [Potamilus streckersoni]|uniref:RING-type domain-containing protein n=1 Tax=Potamilus streckersoni TaxID=2493646 RepID=A0AAE0RW94_9BIVA|nr:hypothetical protein CHS0354_017925 [Potamilus streckersoni]
MIRSPVYSSYQVRLSTFANFPAIYGADVHRMAAAGLYYTGHHDMVRCYACGGALKSWEPEDDPWEEHCKWFPDCPHLEQSNYKPQTRELRAEESNIKFEEKPLASGGKESSSDLLAERLHELTIEELKSKKQEAESDMTTPAALAVLDFGYSRNAVRVAIKVLRDKGQKKLTADSILQVLISTEDKGIILPSYNGKETSTKTSDVVSESQAVCLQTLSTKDEQLSGCKSNTKLTSKANDDAELCHLLLENEQLTKQMMCKRCRQRERNILVLPCTHFCLCEQCSKEVSLCPECWKPINERVKTYLP